METSYKVVAYFTNDDIYGPCAVRLIESLDNFGMQYDVVEIDNFGSWQANTQFKSKFLKAKLLENPGLPIVYLDIDSEVVRNPTLFSQIETDIAVYYMDHHLYKKERKKNELISSVVYFGNTEGSMTIVEKWIQKCKVDPNTWDQKLLQDIVGDSALHLPNEYCTIFDDRFRPKEPVILQHQASRQFRKRYPHKIHGKKSRVC